MVLRDEEGLPYLPASSLKGLARWHAEEIAGALQAAGRGGAAGTVLWSNYLVELFGKEGGTRGRVDFGDALAVERRGFASLVHGSSTRDRRSGRSQDERLYFTEDAAATKLSAELSTRGERRLPPQAVLLLLLALRRIEAVGGRRRRGKGHTRVSVEVVEGPEEFAGLTLPAADGDGRFAALFQEFAAPASSPKPGPAPRRTRIPRSPRPRRSRA